MSDRRLPGADLRTLLRPALPTRSSAQALAEDFIPALLAPRPGATVVDLGCGRGESVEAFRAADPTVRWIGVEVGDSEYETRDGSKGYSTELKYAVVAPVPGGKPGAARSGPAAAASIGTVVNDPWATTPARSDDPPF